MTQLSVQYLLCLQRGLRGYFEFETPGLSTKVSFGCTPALVWLGSDQNHAVCSIKHHAVHGGRGARKRRHKRRHHPTASRRGHEVRCTVFGGSQGLSLMRRFKVQHCKFVEMLGPSGGSAQCSEGSEPLEKYSFDVPRKRSANRIYSSYGGRTSPAMSCLLPLHLS